MFRILYNFRHCYWSSESNIGVPFKDVNWRVSKVFYSDKIWYVVEYRFTIREQDGETLGIEYSTISLKCYSSISVNRIIYWVSMLYLIWNLLGLILPLDDLYIYPTLGVVCSLGSGSSDTEDEEAINSSRSLEGIFYCAIVVEEVNFGQPYYLILVSSI
ncbi:hypothetical protein PCH_Pc22g10770 [Penicillium rubens Wisconsin 54-1255]|uniref:Uncharacterized protein n=1 Tax=Penicillium rubens (strain ATCC 28089 / DSM 1075 / NRRL 1951 / Wisconsin 54-1255) TaxID=500485 RepID=B6HVX8_PENRW|nr:hypothetical protein PCH_Pc22g10770 [Penicillium rubens Wisconsin 54-1255]